MISVKYEELFYFLLPMTGYQGMYMYVLNGKTFFEIKFLKVLQ